MLKKCHNCKSFIPKGKIYGLCVNKKQSSQPTLVQKFNGCDNFEPKEKDDKS